MMMSSNPSSWHLNSWTVWLAWFVGKLWLAVIQSWGGIRIAGYPSHYYASIIVLMYYCHILIPYRRWGCCIQYHGLLEEDRSSSSSPWQYWLSEWFLSFSVKRGVILYVVHCTVLYNVRVNFCTALVTVLLVEGNLRVTHHRSRSKWLTKILNW